MRFDLRSLKKTDEGFLIIPTRFSRVGVQEYPDSREYRPAEEVFSEDSMESFRGKPVTFLHPGEDVTAENANKHTVGTILSFDRENDEFTSGEVVIHEKFVVDYILNRRENGQDVQMSCGYSVEIEKQEGKYNGIEYDAIQRNIRGNHVAIVTQGRAGRDVAMKLDEKNKNDNNKRRDTMKIRLDAIPGTEIGSVEINTEKAEDITDVLKSRDDSVRKAFGETEKKLAELKKKNDELEAKKDSFEEKEKELKEKLDSYSDPNSDTVKALIDEQVKLKEAAETCEIKTDGMSTKDVKINVIEKTFKNADLEGKSDDYINARYDSAVEILSEKKKKDTAAAYRPPVGAESEEEDDTPRLDSLDYSKIGVNGIEK